MSLDASDLQTLAQSVAQNTSRESSECVYARGGEPVCIVGHIFTRLQVPVSDMESWGQEGIDALYNGSYKRVDPEMVVESLPEVTDRGIVYLTALQRIQDADPTVDFPALVARVPLPDMPKANYDVEDLVDRILEDRLQSENDLQRA